MECLRKLVVPPNEKLFPLRPSEEVWQEGVSSGWYFFHDQSCGLWSADLSVLSGIADIFDFLVMIHNSLAGGLHLLEDD